MDKFVTKRNPAPEEEPCGSGLQAPKADNSDEDHSESDSDSRDGSEQVTKKRKIAYKQKFTEKWSENDQSIKEWLVKSNKQMMCRVCNKEIAGGITHIKRHSSTKLHIRNMGAAKKSKKITELLIPEKQRSLQKNIKSGEFKLIMFIAEHNLPFRTLDHLSKLMSSVCSDSEIAKQLTCGRTKGTNVCLKSIGPFSFQEVVKNLQNSYFSLIIDETTDITTSKCLAVVARYFCKYNIYDNFVGLIEVSQSTAEGLFNAVTKLLNDNNIPYKNLVGFAADNCAVMMGDKSGVKARFREKNPNIFVLGCSCHSFHLAASAACCKLPQSVEKFARDVYTYFSHSSKKLGELKECQVFADVEPHKLLKLSQTRWLSLQAVVSRLVEQWPALILHFTAAAMEKDCAYDVNAFLNALNNKCFKLYFYFLAYILKIVNILNLEFQSETPKLYLLHDRLTSTYKTILSNFIKMDVIDKSKDNLHLINISNPENYIPLEKMYIGAQSELLIKQSNLNDTDLKPVRIHCLNFYVELCLQIKNRFDFNDPILIMLKMLNPNSLLLGSTESIVECKIHFPNLVEDVEQLNDEWRFLNQCEEIHKFKDLPLGEFWGQVLEMKNALDQPLFPNLKKLLSGLLSFPHSSAAAERIFSQLNMIKTKARNRLSVDTCNALLLTKQLLKESNCYSFEPDDKLLNYNSSITVNDVDCAEDLTF